MVNDILMNGFEDELEKIAASRSFLGDINAAFGRSLGDLFPKSPKVPSLNLRSTARSGPPTGPPGQSFRSISRKLGLPDERAFPMIRTAKRRARKEGRSALTIYEEMAKGG